MAYVEAVGGGSSGVAVDKAVKGMLHRDLAAIVLAEDSTDDGAFLLSEGVSCDVVGDAEEDERMEDGLEF
jgi:hypothetical protein